MIKKIIIILIILINGQNSFCFDINSYLEKTKFDINSYLEKTKDETDSAFILNFPYDKYIETYGIDKISVLENHRLLIKQSKSNYEELIFNVFIKYYEEKIITVENIPDLSMTISDGIFLLNSENIFADSTTIYIGIGDFILSKCAKELERGIKQKEINSEDAEINCLLSKLEDNQFYIRIDKSDFDKLCDNIRIKNWNYIWSRIKNRYISSPGCYTIGLLTFVLLTILVIQLIKCLKIKRKKK